MDWISTNFRIRVLTEEYIGLPKDTVIEIIGVTKDDRWVCRLNQNNDMVFYAYTEDIMPVSKDITMEGI